MTEFAVIETLSVLTTSTSDNNNGSSSASNFVVTVVIIFDIYLGIVALIGFFLDKYRKLVLYNSIDTKP